MELDEIKKLVAQLMVDQSNRWDEIYGGERRPTPDQIEHYNQFRKGIDRTISELIPKSEKLTICLSGVAAEGVSHYDIEDSLQTFFKPGEGVQYDSESGQFWMYVKPSLVHQVLRWIDCHFPGKINLNISPNRYTKNPWFQNWTQAERYLASLEVSAETGE